VVSKKATIPAIPAQVSFAPSFHSLILPLQIHHSLTIEKHSRNIVTIQFESIESHPILTV